MQQRLWAGIDAGKTAHHCMVVDADGQRVLSRRIDNDESALLELIRAVTSLAEGGHLTWAIDLNAGGAALLITLLLAHDQELLYIPGRTVHHAAGSYRGDGKTDAKDATIIADQARMRRDLHPLRRGDELAAELRILTSRRSDLSADRTRTINRLRERLGEYFPALERAFDYSNNQAALISAHRLPNPGCAAPHRHRPSGDMAAKPPRTQGFQRRGQRSRGCPHPVHGGARRAAGRRPCRSPDAGGDRPRRRA